MKKFILFEGPMKNYCIKVGFLMLMFLYLIFNCEVSQ